uniref:Uncharacterized protein n=1 Tax=Oryza punctata TaxID=4537 RepID=A0A0E0MHI8_ORYPU
MDFSKGGWSEEQFLAAMIDPPVMEKRKTKMVRLTQQHINNCIAFNVDIPDDPDEESLPKLSEVLSKDLLDRVPPEVLDSLIKFENTRGERKARWAKLQDDLREERDAILNQYYTRGYAECEIYDDDDDDDEQDNKAPARVAPPGRNGVTMKKNQSGGNIRKISFSVGPSPS